MTQQNLLSAESAEEMELLEDEEPTQQVHSVADSVISAFVILDVGHCQNDLKLFKCQKEKYWEFFFVKNFL